MVRKKKGATKHTIVYDRDALDGLATVEPEKRRALVKKKIDRLANNPRPAGARKLTNVEHEGQPVYRIRSGDYRMLYMVSDNDPVVTVLDIGHRKDIYR